MKEQGTELEKKVKEKDDQYLDLVGISDKKFQDKDAELKQMTKQLEEITADIKLKDVEITENNLAIKHFNPIPHGIFFSWLPRGGVESTLPIENPLLSV